MQYRALGHTGLRVSSVSFGAWAIGSAWGPVDDAESLRALETAVGAGVNFIDTADVYGDGRSERLIGEILRRHPHDGLIVATKAGRRLPEQTADGYTREQLTAWVERSLQNLGTSAIDLLQLHCPPDAVYDRPEIFGILDDLVTAGKIRHYGVSVETVDQAHKALAYPGVASVQIIFNMLRQKPADHFLEEARARQVGVLARLPLSSGLLTGKFRRDTVFDVDDHRHFNRDGERFDRGETFSGVPFDDGLAVVDRLRPLVPQGTTLAAVALRWILMFDAVSCVIPGARTERQARENAAAADLPPLTSDAMRAVARVYDSHLRALVHPYW